MFKKREARLSLAVFGAILTVLFFISGQMRPAKAVTVTTDLSGKLVKGSAPAVYFVGSDSKRYVFPNENVFFSWYDDFSGVMTITDKELVAIPIAGDVIIRAEPRLMKIEGDPKVYALSSLRTLQWVSTEELAKELFGTDWARKVETVPAVEFANYQIGEPMDDGGTATSPPEEPGQTVNANTPAVDAFKIASVVVDLLSVDATTDPISQTWNFKIAYNAPPSGARLTVTEKSTGAVFFNEPIVREKTTAATTNNAIGGGIAKLKMNAVYSWKVIAYAAPNATAAQTAVAFGEFKTISATIEDPKANINTATPAVGANTNEPATVPKTPVPSTLKIVSVSVDKLDAQGYAAEDVRSFGITFSGAATQARLTITEKVSGATFYSEPIAKGGSLAASTYVSPGSWTAKLKPNTAYTWTITAYPAGTTDIEAVLPASATGEFTTSDFTPTVTAPTTTAAPAFKIVSVTVDRLDALGNAAEDVRSFGLAFNVPARGVRLTIVEKYTGAAFYSESVAGGAILSTTAYVSPGNWKTKLKPNTAYTWTISAYPGSVTSTVGIQAATATGDFLTSNFTPAATN